MVHVESENGPARVVIYNSQARRRQEMVTIRVSNPNIVVGTSRTRSYGRVTIRVSNLIIVVGSSKDMNIRSSMLKITLIRTLG